MISRIEVPPIRNWYEPRVGKIEAFHKQLGIKAANADNFIERFGYESLSSALSSYAMADSMVSSFYNAPNNADLAGQYVGRYSVTGNTDDLYTGIGLGATSILDATVVAGFASIPAKAMLKNFVTMPSSFAATPMTLQTGSIGIKTGVASKGVTPTIKLVEGSYSLAGANRAVIDPRKLTEYALNPSHPVGGNKAKVFESALGFTKNNADDLILQLRKGVMKNTPIPGKIDQYGSRFTVDIPVVGPSGKGTVRSGWIYKPGSNIPELTTIFVK